MIKLDILSDPICPWCFIGKTQLDRALEGVEQTIFTREWHPFQLNPDMPAGGMDRREYLERKFGGKDGAVQAYAQIEDHAKAIGLDIDFAAMKRTPSTVDAHRLIYWAGLESVQDIVVEHLFDAYFCKGQDIGDAGTLVSIADKAGLDADVITRLLSGDQDAQLIRDRDAHSRQRGVNSVPTFIVDNQYAVPGAQPPEVWAKVVQELTAKVH